MAELKEFNQNVIFTPGNAGTLDMLNRGEIAMGPVWVDMFYTWKADGRLRPNMKLKLIGPGMPGQPMYYVVPAKAANAELAKKFMALATSPEVQAEGIVKRFNWYPGHRRQARAGASSTRRPGRSCSRDVTPEDLGDQGQAVPGRPLLRRDSRGLREAGRPTEPLEIRPGVRLRPRRESRSAVAMRIIDAAAQSSSAPAVLPALATVALCSSIRWRIPWSAPSGRGRRWGWPISSRPTSSIATTSLFTVLIVGAFDRTGRLLARSPSADI